MLCVLCTNKKKRETEGKRPSPEDYTGSWVQSELGFVGFAAWFVGSPTGFAAGFVVDLLLHVVSALISCLCLCSCFCYFFSCRGFFFRGEEEEEEEETEAYWFSFVEFRV